MWRSAGLLTILLVILTPGIYGAESVYLTNGFTIEVESHTREGQAYIFHNGAGTTEIPVAEVLRIEYLATPDQSVKDDKTGPVASLSPDAIVRKAAVEQGILEDFVYSVAKVESGFRQNSVSAKGAVGLMQLMPSTALSLGIDSSKATSNAAGGARYLRELLLRYHGNSALALAAYNAGPGAVAKYKGIPPYAETRAYVVRVLKEYERQTNARASLASRNAGAQLP